MAENIKRFETGAVRSLDAEATRYDLISPIALESYARTCAEGAAKYGDHNWERGMAAHDLLNHAIRHIYIWLSGDRSEDHLGHALWNVGGAIHSVELWPHLNEGHLRVSGCLPPGTPRRPETEEEFFDAIQRPGTDPASRLACASHSDA